MEPGLPAALPLTPTLPAAAQAGGPGEAQGWLGTKGQCQPQPGGTKPLGTPAPSPRAQASSGMLPPPLQPGHLHPGLLQAQPWEKDTEAGITASTPTVPSARLGVLSTLGAPAGRRRDLSSTHGEAASVTCPSPFYPLGS